MVVLHRLEPNNNLKWCPDFIDHYTSDEMKHRADELGVLYFIEKPLHATFLPLAIEAIFEGLDLQKQQGISSN